MTLNLHDSVESDLRVSLVNNGWCVPTRSPFSLQPRIIDLRGSSPLAESPLPRFVLPWIIRLPSSTNIAFLKLWGPPP
ncbi:hypothetical protein TNCV_3368611 [Trichonephila clavipes]|nr:hypothetical protein TNCV_3368611 [Trichonephila clavipes]